MRIFISYSQQDKSLVDKISNRLSAAGHDIWIDSIKIDIGDNIQQKIQEGIEEADVLIVVISKNSFRSEWVQKEFSAIAFQQISKGERRIIPIKIDKSEVPSYLADRVYLDFSQDFESGLERLIETLGTETLESMAPQAVDILTPTEGRATQVKKLREALHQGRLTLVCGAGVSVAAGIPAWGDLLVRLLETMINRISKKHLINVSSKAAPEFQSKHGESSLILGKYLKNNLGRDFQSEMRDALYKTNPDTSAVLESIVGLSRPQRDARPLDSIITFNFDCLIEENLSKACISNRPIFSEAIKHDSHELPIYHVHGFLPRTDVIPENMELVFSEDAYHSQFIDSFSWSNLIQLNKLTQNTCLLVGISLSDPNMRRLLDVAWRKNPDKVLSHFIVKKLPQPSPKHMIDKISKLLEEQDANALGLNVIWIDNYDDLPNVLNEISQYNLEH